MNRLPPIVHIISKDSSITSKQVMWPLLEPPFTSKIKVSKGGSSKISINNRIEKCFYPAMTKQAVRVSRPVQSVLSNFSRKKSSVGNNVKYRGQNLMSMEWP